jgi:hypothetical protein
LDIGTEASCGLPLRTPSFPDASKGYPPSFLQRDCVWSSGLQLGCFRALTSHHFLYPHETSAVVEQGQLTTRSSRSVSDCLGFDEGVASLESKPSDRFQRVLSNEPSSAAGGRNHHQPSTMPPACALPCSPPVRCNGWLGWLMASVAKPATSGSSAIANTAHWAWRNAHARPIPAPIKRPAMWSMPSSSCAVITLCGAPRNGFQCSRHIIRAGRYPRAPRSAISSAAMAWSPRHDTVDTLAIRVSPPARSWPQRCLERRFQGPLQRGRRALL